VIKNFRNKRLITYLIMIYCVISIASMESPILSISQKKEFYPEYDKSFLMGKYDPQTHPDFTLCDKYVSDDKTYLQTEVFEAFLEMAEAASKDDIHLQIISGTRTFDQQKEFWEYKIKAISQNKFEKMSTFQKNKVIKHVLQFTAMPGTSRHHWGTEIDIVSSDPVFYQSQEGKELYKWMLRNAGDFGFRQVYNDNVSRSGHQAEPWHWSYYRLTVPIYYCYLSKVTQSDIKGFVGEEFAQEILVINKYVTGINPDVK